MRNQRLSHNRFSQTNRNLHPKIRPLSASWFFVAVCWISFFSAAHAEIKIQDIFGRSLSEHGITLVDRDGYMANPLIKFRLVPPLDAALPGTFTLSANGERLYFNNPCQPGADGPKAFRPVTEPDKPVVIKMSIFPAHTAIAGPCTLKVVFTDANNISQTNTVAIRVLEQDTHRANEFGVAVNFALDATGFFTNRAARGIVQQAADDWSYYFAGMDLDATPPGAESTWIWNDNWDGGHYFTSTNNFTGYQLYAYGTSNRELRSGGETSYAGRSQASHGIPLAIHRSGAFEACVEGNYNKLHWLYLTNDADWLATQNLRHQTNDFYSIAHHEIGHALIFNKGHPGFSRALANKGFTSAAVRQYYGKPVPISISDDHLTGVIDPESGQGAFGYEYYGEIPRCRWTMTKLDLLCAQEVGYTLRSNAAFASFTFPKSNLPAGQQGRRYEKGLTATGGIPIYNWGVTEGSLPPGLSLDPFTGELSGVPTRAGVYRFTVCVQDYHEFGEVLSQDFALTIQGAEGAQANPSTPAPAETIFRTIQRFVSITATFLLASHDT